MITSKSGTRNLNLANSRDNWYRGSQGVYVFSKVEQYKDTHR